MVEEKKATEVIQEIKNGVDEILAYIRNMDLKYTLMLDRLNKLSMPSTSVAASPQMPLQQSTKQQPTVESSEIDFPEYNVPEKTQVATNLKSKLQLALEQAEKDQEDSDELSVDNNQSGKRRNLRQHAESQARQIPTQQRMTYADGKPIFMASVDIFDSGQRLIKQTKTNQVGKWLAPLSPGEYSVTVTKGGNSLKPKVELSYQVTIPNQDSTVDLGTKVVET